MNNHAQIVTNKQKEVILQPTTTSIIKQKPRKIDLVRSIKQKRIILKKKHNKIGRPTKKTEYVTKKLVSIFKLGVNVTTALNYAKISSQVFYGWYNSDMIFRSKIDSAREFGIIASTQVVTNSIVRDKDVDTAKWYLERKSKDFQLGNKSGINITGDKVLVIPSELLTKHDIVNDNEHDAVIKDNL